MKQIKATVVSNNEVMSRTRLVWLESPQIAVSARPGQFVMIRCGEDTLLPRPLSTHQVDRNKLALLFTIVGKGTRWLSQRKPGDIVALFGPLGNGFSIQPSSKNLLLIAGGIGIAPLYFLAQEAQREQYSVTLIHGAPKATHLYPKEIPTGIKIITLTEDGSEGQRGMITDLLPDFIDWADQVFTCGPMPMYKAMAQMAELKDRQIQISLEVRMGCGRGLCYGCTIKTKRGLKKVCQDGPVFNLDDILWDELNHL